MATGLATHQEQIGALRRQVIEVVPELELVSDLRLGDMIMWTSWTT